MSLEVIVVMTVVMTKTKVSTNSHCPFRTLGMRSLSVDFELSYAIFAYLALIGSLISRECGSYVYEKRDIRRPDNECRKVSLVLCRKVCLFCI